MNPFKISTYIVPLFLLVCIFYVTLSPTVARAIDWTQNLIFHAPFTDPENPLQVSVGNGQFTFARISSATFIHPVTNLVTVAGYNATRYSEDFSTTWVSSSTSVIVNQTTAPDGTMTADEIVVGSASDGNSNHYIQMPATTTTAIQQSQVYTVSVYAKAKTNTWIGLSLIGKNGGANTCYFNTSTGVRGTCTANATGTSSTAPNGFYRFSVSANTLSGASLVQQRISLANGDNAPLWTGNGTNSVYLWGAQLNSGPALATYVKTTDTAMAQARIEAEGYLAEGVRSNIALWSRNLANAVWIKTNATVAQTATGRDGVSNSASTVTATADNATICQTVTTTATTSASIDIKRISGSGGISLTLDNGATYSSDFSTSLSGSDWYRAFYQDKKITNPTFCIKIGTSGDSFALDYAQVEVSGTPSAMTGASYISSRIPTTSTASTRFLDKLSIPSAGNWPVTEGSFFVIGDVWDTAGPNKFFLDGTDPARVILHIRSASGNGANGIPGRTTIYDGSSECSYSSVNVEPRTQTKMATRWSATAGFRGTTASGAVPFNCNFDGAMEIVSPMVLADAHVQDGSRVIWGHLKQMRIWDTYFSDEYMQAATLGAAMADIGVPADTTAPSISDVASSTTSTSATITWTTNESASSTVQFGLTTGYGTQATSTATSTHSVSLTGLTAGTLYNFRVTAIDAAGNVGTTTNYTFTTSAAPDTTVPSISDVASSTTSTSATITWTTNESASSRIRYGLTQTLSTTTVEKDTVTGVTLHSDTISGLLACTQYFFDVISIDVSGNSATSSTQSLITTGCTSNSSVVNSTVGSITVSGGGTVSLVSASESALLTIPEDVSSTTTSLIIQSKNISGNVVLGAVTAPDQFTGIANHVYDFKAYTDLDTVVTTFDEPITITLTYSDNSISSIDESTLRIYRFTGTEWTPLDNCIVNQTLNRVSCTTTHFSVFALFGIANPTPTAPSTPIVSAGPVARGGYTPLETPSAILARSKSPSFTPTGTSRTPTVSLRLGARNAEVKILQQALNSLGFPVASAGAGSLGKETDLFGPATKQAVIKWQKASGVVPASGFFGPLSRQTMKSILGK